MKISTQNSNVYKEQNVIIFRFTNRININFYPTSNYIEVESFSPAFKVYKIQRDGIKIKCE